MKTKTEMALYFDAFNESDCQNNYDVQKHGSHSTSLMASLIRSVGGLSKYFYQGLWLADLTADAIGLTINRRWVA